MSIWLHDLWVSETKRRCNEWAQLHEEQSHTQLLSFSWEYTQQMGSAGEWCGPSVKITTRHQTRSLVTSLWSQWRNLGSIETLQGFMDGPLKRWLDHAGLTTGLSPEQLTTWSTFVSVTWRNNEKSWLQVYTCPIHIWGRGWGHVGCQNANATEDWEDREQNTMKVH